MMKYGILYYSSSLAAGTVTQVESYLRTKWGTA